VTEQEWLTSNDPDDMLKRLGRRISNRKRRLFGCACYRHVPRLFEDERIRTAVEVSERYADGFADKQELAHALSLAFSRMWARGGPMAYPTPRCARAARRATARAARDGGAERQYQAALLRCIFGNPFRRVAGDPAWLRWRDGAAAHIARAIYDDRRFQDLPILADALEEAGCTDAEILGHCRGPGEHVRGCWVVDLVLGKK
jgi:hypothetical protein